MELMYISSVTPPRKQNTLVSLEIERARQEPGPRSSIRPDDLRSENDQRLSEIDFGVDQNERCSKADQERPQGGIGRTCAP